MAKNPMQRKAQNSFLLGILITLLITGLIIAFLGMQLTKITKEQQESKARLKQVYVLSQDINSGDTISDDKLILQSMDYATIPENALSLADLAKINNVTDENGNIIKKVNIISKINLKKGTIITSDMLKKEGETNSDVRKAEYNVIVPTSQLKTGKYIDVRLRLPNGKDYIVVSHKKVEIPLIDGVESSNSMWLEMSETEILTLSCAIIEAYKMEGSLLYATEYIEPGLQDAATTTYLPDDQTLNLMRQDPNCLAEAKNAIFQRNNTPAIKDAIRNPINSSLNQNATNAQENVKEGVEEEIQKTQEERQKYLDSLSGNY